MKITAFLFSLLALVLSLSGCSPSSALSPEALFGGTALGVGGGIAGHYIGEELGYTKDGEIAGAAIGGALGLLAGGRIYEGRREAARDTLPVERVPTYRDDGQVDIDAHAREVHDATKWGKGESKPWRERYMDYEDNLPYQGGVGY